MFKITIRIAMMAALAAATSLAQSAAKDGSKKAASGKQQTQAKPAVRAASEDPEVKPYIPKPMAPPAGAVEIAPGEWRYIEKGSAGKPDTVWIYRRTPFGLAKSPETDTGASAEEGAADLQAVDKGDSVEFTRNSPFGVKRWSKKKSELDELERAAFQRTSRKTASSK